MVADKKYKGSTLDGAYCQRKKNTEKGDILANMKKSFFLSDLPNVEKVFSSLFPDGFSFTLGPRNFFLILNQFAKEKIRHKFVFHSNTLQFSR